MTGPVHRFGDLFGLDPEGLGTDGPIERRRLAEGLGRSAVGMPKGAIRLEGETLRSIWSPGSTERTVPVLDPAGSTGCRRRVRLRRRPSLWTRVPRPGTNSLRSPTGLIAPIPRGRAGPVAYSAQPDRAGRAGPARGRILAPHPRVSACAFIDPEGTFTAVAVALHAAMPRG